MSYSRRINQLQRRRCYAVVGVRDSGKRVAAERNTIPGNWGSSAKPDWYTGRIRDRHEGRGVDALGKCTEELILRSKVIRKAEIFDVGTIDEYDLRLDRHLRRAHIEIANIIDDTRHA